MNGRKNVGKSPGQNEAKIIRLNPKPNFDQDKVVQRAISEVYFDSLKEIDDLINDLGSEI